MTDARDVKLRVGHVIPDNSPAIYGWVRGLENL
jgi:hypothetical protein